MSITPEPRDDRTLPVRYFRFRFGDVFGDGSEPLARWVFSTACVANDTLFVLDLIDQRSGRGRYRAAESFFLWRVASSQAFEGCKLLFGLGEADKDKARGKELQAQVDALLGDVEEIQEDLKTLRAARCKGIMHWEAGSPGRTLRNVTYHLPKPWEEESEPLWRALASVQDEEAETVVALNSGKRPRYLFVDKVFGTMVGDHLFDDYEEEVDEIDKVVRAFANVATRIIPHYADTKGIDPESTYSRLHE